MPVPRMTLSTMRRLSSSTFLCSSGMDGLRCLWCHSTGSEAKETIR